ncbi:MAG: hypothetical protein EXQ71_08140 [Acidimicrobiia bacterium]|nr:hypothetical protein [Acidimicrobiia bacterium]
MTKGSDPFVTSTRSRGPLGLTRRQAGGQFTRDEASLLIDQLLQADPLRETPIGADPSLEQRSARDRREAERVQSLRGMPTDLLADELRRRGWSVTEP